MTGLAKIKLSKCYTNSNCHLEEWKFDNLDKAFTKIVELSISMPRTIILEQTNIYWHGVCKSLIFKFPDDLEVLKEAQTSTIQIKSSSRYGAYDLGVNKKRINYLYNELTKLGITKILSK
tara:strand:+ start:20 stop:379 length:360 start_codon:yes stop_codon:yes gene_type:complete